MKLILIVLVILLCMSCTSIRHMEENMYIQSMYRGCLKDPNCGTDMDYELIDRAIYEKLYSCRR